MAKGERPAKKKGAHLSIQTSGGPSEGATQTQTPTPSTPVPAIGGRVLLVTPTLTTPGSTAWGPPPVPVAVTTASAATPPALPPAAAPSPQVPLASTLMFSPTPSASSAVSSGSTAITPTNQADILVVIKMLVEQGQGSGRAERAGVLHFRNIQGRDFHPEQDNVDVWLRQVESRVEADEELQGRVRPQRTLYTYVLTMLAGAAAEWFNNVSSTIANKNENHTSLYLSQLMHQQFGSALSSEEKIRKIMTRTKRPKEIYAEYADELRKIGMGSTIGDRFFVTAFSEGIDATTGALLSMKAPISLNEAVAAVARLARGKGADNLTKRLRAAKVLVTRVHEESSEGDVDETPPPPAKRARRGPSKTGGARGTGARAVRPHETPEAKAEQLTKIRCYNCRELGCYSKAPSVAASGAAMEVPETASTEAVPRKEILSPGAASEGLGAQSWVNRRHILDVDADNLPTTTVTIRGRELDLKIDTCAACSVAGGNMKKRGVKLDRRPTVDVVYGLGDAPFRVEGVWRFIAATKYHQRLEWDSLVIADNDDEFIFGKDFLEAKRTNISFRDHELTFHAGSELVVLSSQCTEVRVRKVTSLRNGRGSKLVGASRPMLRVPVNGAEGETGVFAPRADLKLRVLIATTLATVRDGATALPLVNVGGKRAKMPARHLLGDWVPVDCEAEVVLLAGSLSRNRVIHWIEHMRKEPKPLPDEENLNTSELSAEDRKLILKVLRCHPTLLKMYEGGPPPTTTGVEHCRGALYHNSPQNTAHALVPEEVISRLGGRMDDLRT